MAIETLTLAPAAGSGIGKLLADALLADPDFVQELADVAKRGLRAEMAPRWDPIGKQWAEAQPDYKTQIQTLALILSHMEGEPIKRIIHQHVGEGKTVDPVKAMQASPELRESVRRQLNRAEFKTRNTKTAEPSAAPVTVEIDVE